MHQSKEYELKHSSKQMRPAKFDEGLTTVLGSNISINLRKISESIVIIASIANFSNT